MSFISVSFFCFFVLLLLFLQLVKKHDPLWSKWGILVANAFFLYAFDVRFLLAALAVSGVTYLATHQGKAHPWVKNVGILSCLLFLAYGKYASFFVASFSALFQLNLAVLKTFSFLGISYYTFSAIGTILDVSWDKQPAMGLLDTTLYLTYFPKFIAGPLMKAQDFKLDKSDIAWGVQIIVFGAFKKHVLADNLGLFVDTVFSSPALFSSWTLSQAVVGYMLQLYFDFSGYCDIGYGISKCIGITLPRNFDLPYLSRSLQEFWHRWHITMGVWFKDYLFMPLSLSRFTTKLRGSCKSRKAKRLVPLICCTIVVWTATGLWHGPSWNYVLWGLYHGVLLSLSLLFAPFFDRTKKHTGFVVDSLRIVRTFAMVAIGEVFFRADSLSLTSEIFRGLFSSGGIVWTSRWLFTSLLFLFLAEGYALKRSGLANVHGSYLNFNLKTFWGLVIFLSAIGITLAVAYNHGGVFIYGAF